MTTLIVADAPSLHVPDEPLEHRRRWFSSVLEGSPVEDVIVGDGGVAEWLWTRWRVLETAGLSRPAFTGLVAGYRRELWLWLAGERTWEQCCSGLIGRIVRRLPG
ncbi:MAG TPA: hypothetical protein VKG43_04760 [Acidimicrobiales bacterium]|nr:hypothetical protein [Acidimicrobiales bacterium]